MNADTTMLMVTANAKLLATLILGYMHGQTEENETVRIHDAWEGPGPFLDSIMVAAGHAGEGLGVELTVEQAMRVVTAVWIVGGRKTDEEIKAAVDKAVSQ